MAKLYNVYGADIETNIEDKPQVEYVTTSLSMRFGTVNFYSTVPSGYIQEVGDNNFVINLNIPRGPKGTSGDDSVFRIEPPMTVFLKEYSYFNLQKNGYANYSLFLGLPRGDNGYDGTILGSYIFTTSTSEDGGWSYSDNVVDNVHNVEMVLPRGEKGEKGEDREIYLNAFNIKHGNNAVPSITMNPDGGLNIGLPMSSTRANGRNGVDGRDGVTPELFVYSFIDESLNDNEIRVETKRNGLSQSTTNFYFPTYAPKRDGIDGVDGIDGAKVNIDIGDVEIARTEENVKIEVRELGERDGVIDFYLPKSIDGIDGVATPKLGCDIPDTLVPGSWPTYQWLYRGEYYNLHLGLPRGYDGLTTPTLTVGNIQYTKDLEDIGIRFNHKVDRVFQLEGKFPLIAANNGEQGELGDSPRPNFYIELAQDGEEPRIACQTYEEYLEAGIYETIIYLPNSEPGLGAYQITEHGKPQDLVVNTHITNGDARVTITPTDQNYSVMDIYVPKGERGDTFDPSFGVSNDLNSKETIKAASSLVVNRLAYNGGLFNTMKKITTSGTFVAPHKGVYKFTLVGAGGGGASGLNFEYANSVPSGFGKPTIDCGLGGGGGAGGSVLEKIFTLTKDEEVQIVIGAGGVGGTVPGASGTAGGNTMITVQGNNFYAQGGQPGKGFFGGSFLSQSTTFVRGASGENGSYSELNWGLGGKGGQSAFGLGVSGSGRGIANPTPNSGAGGGGGNGASKSQTEAGAQHQSGRPGANGQVIIEYYSYQA